MSTCKIFRYLYRVIILMLYRLMILLLAIWPNACQQLMKTLYHHPRTPWGNIYLVRCISLLNLSWFIAVFFSPYYLVASTESLRLRNRTHYLTEPGSNMYRLDTQKNGYPMWFPSLTYTACLTPIVGIIMCLQHSTTIFLEEKVQIYFYNKKNWCNRSYTRSFLSSVLEGDTFAIWCYTLWHTYMY